MKYILMRTVSGKTYYARTEENNAIKKQRISLWHRDLHQRRMQKNAGPGKQET